MVQSCLLSAWQLWQDSREFVDCLNEDGLVLPRAAKKSGKIEGQAELNKQRRLIWAASHDRLRSLAGKAVDTLEAVLDSGDIRNRCRGDEGGRPLWAGQATRWASGRRVGYVGEGQRVGVSGVPI